MRRAPLNYLAALAVGGLLWLATGLWLARYLSEASSLQMTIDAFDTVVYLAFGALAVVAILGAWYWYYYGSRPATLANMNGARHVWDLTLAVQVMLMVLLLVALVILFRAESIPTTGYVILAAAAAVQAPLFFWLVTAMMSPRGVKYVPRGVR